MAHDKGFIEKTYAQVYCHLDNDEAGENAHVELQKRYGDKVIDHSHLYTGYKDLNEYLMSHKTRKVTIIQKHQDNEEEQ